MTGFVQEAGIEGKLRQVSKGADSDAGGRHRDVSSAAVKTFSGRSGTSVECAKGGSDGDAEID
jgi:hypothetical protein